MQAAITADDKDQILRLATLFKNIGQQAEGLQLYSAFVLGPYLKQIEGTMQRMYESDHQNNLSEYFAQVS